MADIDFGQLSEALNDKSDRDLRNVDTTAKADAVIDYQEPTSANNYTWYRKYKSGWIEQGGLTGAVPSSNDPYLINLLCPMSDTNYCIFFTKHNSSTGAGSSAYVQDFCLYTNTTTSFTICRSYNGPIRWQVSGISA